MGHLILMRDVKPSPRPCSSHFEIPSMGCRISTQDMSLFSRPCLLPLDTMATRLVCKQGAEQIPSLHGKQIFKLTRWFFHDHRRKCPHIGYASIPLTTMIPLGEGAVTVADPVVACPSVLCSLPWWPTMGNLIPTSITLREVNGCFEVEARGSKQEPTRYPSPHARLHMDHSRGSSRIASPAVPSCT